MVGFSRDFKYIPFGKVTSEEEGTNRFLERQAGAYEIKRRGKDIQKSLLFMHDVKVKWIVPGHYKITEMSGVNHEEHWLLHLREKVHFIEKSICLIGNFNIG